MANKGMGNRFPERGGGTGTRKTWRNANQTFVNYTLYRVRVRVRDRSGNLNGEKENTSDLGKQSGFCGD